MIKRRSFVKLCTGALAMVGAHPDALAAQGATQRSYERVRLLAPHGEPVRPASLAIGENYVFNYPFVTTPCFLINLGRRAADPARLRTEDGATYRWSGGVGPERSVVSFSAICAHRMSYPAQAASFINYRHTEARFQDRDHHPVERAQVIYCCSEKSVYDPAHGARVLGGPAPQPLAAIILEYDAAEDALYATGTSGGEMFDRFFEKFSFRLALDYRTPEIHARVRGSATVLPLAEFTRNQIMCGAV